MEDNSENIDQRLRDAFVNTVYRVQKPALDIRIGNKNEALDIFLFDNHVWHWAFISAWNPGAKQLSASENEARHLELVSLVHEMGLRTCPAWGVPEKTQDWSAEKSLLILDIEREQAIALGRKFDQMAIICGYFGSEPELVWLR